MADVKVSALTAATGAALVSADLLYVVAGGVGKKIAVSEMFKSVPDGTVGAPAIAFQGAQTTGFWRSNAVEVSLSLGASQYYKFAVNEFTINGGSTDSIIRYSLAGTNKWAVGLDAATSNGAKVAATDLLFFNDANTAYVAALAANGSYLNLNSTTTDAVLGIFKSGTKRAEIGVNSANGVHLRRSNSGIDFLIDSSGFFGMGVAPVATHTLHLGIVGAIDGSIKLTGGNTAIGSTGQLYVDTVSGTCFRTGIVQFAGISSAFPALRRAGSGLDVILADASAYASLTANGLISTTYVSTGPIASSSGAIRLSNGTYIGARNAANSGDVRIIEVLTTDKVQIDGGNSGTIFGSTFIAIGGSTNAYPALKRNATFIETRLADDSDYAGLVTGTLYVWDGVASRLVTFGANDSGGAGFRLMKVPNV